MEPAVAALLSIEEIFDDEYFSGGGAGYVNYLDEAQILRAHGRRYGQLLVKAGARDVLDVGAAGGFILRGMVEAGCRGTGVELNASMAAYAVRELALDVRTTTLEKFETGERFDAVTLLQVVDHFDDIRESLACLRALTKPNGMCLIEFGNRASWTARVLGSAWHEYAPPSVRRVFSLRALCRLLAEYGFSLRSWGHPPKYLRADHAFSLLRYKAQAPIVKRVLARLAEAIPPNAKLRYVGDDIVWALFDKQ